MRPGRLLLLGGAMLASFPAWADPSFVLDHVTITGNKSVTTDKLMDAIQERPGSRISQADILADRDSMMKVLEGANVVGSVGARITTKPNKHVLVEFTVDDRGVQAPTVTKVAARLNTQIFEGNKALTTEQLRAASGLNPGDTLTDATVQAAEKAIQAAYAKSKLPLDVNITGSIAQNAGKVDITWHITEKKGKPKRNTDDEGGQKLDR